MSLSLYSLADIALRVVGSWLQLQVEAHPLQRLLVDGVDVAAAGALDLVIVRQHLAVRLIAIAATAPGKKESQPSSTSD